MQRDRIGAQTWLSYKLSTELLVAIMCTNDYLKRYVSEGRILREAYVNGVGASD